MPATTSLVPRLTDREVITFLREVAAAIGAETVGVMEFGGSNSVPLEAADDAAFVPFADDAVHRIATAAVAHLRFHVTLDRTATQGGDSFLYDQLTVNNTSSDSTPQRPGVDQETIRAVQKLISETFGRDDERVSGLFKNPKLFRDLLASHHRQNVQLQKTVLEVGKQAAEARTLLEQEFARRRVQLEEEFKQLEAERDTAHDKIRAQIAEKEESLLSRERDLDDRSNTHARRELHRDLKVKIAERADSLRVTPETTANRRPIHAAVLLSIALLASMIVIYSTGLASLPSDAPTTLVLLAGLKPLSLTIALLGLLAWYLRWMNRWFERYADTEFQLKQFELDIDRASWVVEAALEWKLSQDRPMPEHLLETISRNLFSKSQKDETADMHPADYLASAILGRASALNLKVPGGEISMTGRDIRRLQKDEATQAG